MRRRRLVSREGEQTQRVKARGNGEGSIYERRDRPGTWAGAFVFDGRRRVVFGSSADDVRRKMAERRAEIEAGVTPPARVSLRDFLGRWLKEAAPNTAGEHTLFTYGVLLDHHVLGKRTEDGAGWKVAPSSIADIPLKALTAEAVSAWVAELRAKRVDSPRAKNKILSHATIHSVWRTLRNSLNVARSWGLISTNPAAAVRMKKPAPATVDTFSIEDTREFLDLASRDRLEALFVLAATMGLREGELIGLRLKLDLDLENRQIHVRKQLQRISGKVVELDAKQESRRTLNLPEMAVEALKRHLKQRQDEEIEAGDKWNESGRLFTTQVGTRLEARNLLRQFYRIREKMGRQDFRFHDLRHSTATVLYTEGVHEKAIQELLGHKSSRTTSEVYLHVVPKARRHVADAMDTILKPKRKRKTA